MLLTFTCRFDSFLSFGRFEGPFFWQCAFVPFSAKLANFPEEAPQEDLNDPRLMTLFGRHWTILSKSYAQPKVVPRSVCA